MFKKLFSKKDKDGKPPIDLSDAVNRSTLKMWSFQLFMHYYDKATSVDPNNPTWQNQALFFWSANEPFEKKSLPAEFKNHDKRYFIVNKVPDELNVASSIAMPWFGMPGKGKKYFFAKEKNPVGIASLAKNESISYVEQVPLIWENLDILHDRANYYLLLDTETSRYDFGLDKFYFKDQESTLGEIYKHGGVLIIKPIRS